ncbi:hypothetical protein AXK56_15855 [Tsukamurella pulmonis]|uniref:Uncharacterized protein n=1 Tax=Tsukamurella pulmonis TaxID=47312 RepID=A0A1H1G5R7_9ACTN|nr:hypothetical protein [Tsukamurella pulmonis]KXO87848.1 hypothetical protein AXK56_15855 [Tsukamurella pulmonis]SDR08602.1 hypothetical protein SAMN04489765_3130 [Tsukamurella pulmonis]SUP17815.1 Uncharacterised protein [Tsukamurella pulmonis]
MKFDANFWAAVAALGGVAAAVAAIVTATIAAKTLSAMRQDSLDRSRPVMIAELRPGVLTRNAELHITNQGLSVARNVEVTFAPPIAPHCPGKELSECEHIVHFIAERYARPIPVIAPGADLDNLYQDAEDNDEPVPDNFFVTLKYEDDREREYGDTFELSMTLLRKQSGAYPSTSGEAGERRRLVKAVEHIARGVGRA